MPSIIIKKRSFIFRYLLQILLFACVINIECQAQKFLTDTIYVEFRGDSLIDTDKISIVDIQDSRNENPHFVRYMTRNKYLFIPVDQEIYTREPLSKGITSGISSDTGNTYKYVLDIRKFEIETKKRRFTKPVYLVADIPVYRPDADTLRYLGTLYYDYLYQPLAKKETPVESTENLLNKWHTEFRIDLLTIPSISLDVNPDITPNFITDPKVKSLYLQTLGAIFAGLNWWGLQGEVYFSRPETNSQNTYTTGIIRYQNNSDYESFSLGKNSEHITWRKSRNLMLDADLNILLGFCKWKDIEINKPTIYQLFDVELSSVQSIVFNPINSRGLLARIGLIENISYVIDKKVKLQAGLFFGLGIKL